MDINRQRQRARHWRKIALPENSKRTRLKNRDWKQILQAGLDINANILFYFVWYELSNRPASCIGYSEDFLFAEENKQLESCNNIFRLNIDQDDTIKV